MELTGAEREIGNVGNCRNENWRTLFKEPGGDRISDSDRLLGQLKRIFETLDSDAGLKVEKSGGKAGGEWQCGDAMAGWEERERERERCSLEILSVKKEANLSGRGTDEEEG